MFLDRGIMHDRKARTLTSALVVLLQIFLGKLARMVCMRGEVYSALPSDISVTEASSELRYVNTNDELGLETQQALPKSPTLAIEKVASSRCTGGLFDHPIMVTASRKQA